MAIVLPLPFPPLPLLTRTPTSPLKLEVIFFFGANSAPHYKRPVLMISPAFLWRPHNCATQPQGHRSHDAARLNTKGLKFKPDISPSYPPLTFCSLLFVSLKVKKKQQQQSCFFFPSQPPEKDLIQMMTTEYPTSSKEIRVVKAPTIPWYQRT